MADDASEAPYTLEFYEDDDGHEPARAFMQALEPIKKRAIGVALREVLEHMGPNVAATDFGKSLTGGLYEFRLDQDAEQILRRAGKGDVARPETEKTKILLRVFFHAHGNKLILLLCGYDKAEHTSKPYQNEQIDHARKLLNHWKEREKARQKGHRDRG